MASYYSKPANYGNYTQPLNLDMVNFVLQSKQQKYDYNLAKLDDKITNQLGSLDLVRAEDKEYFLQRASEVMNSMGDLTKLDYSKNGVTRQVDAGLNSIVDDRVLNDVISTKNYRNFQSTIQQKQAKDPDLYSSLNASHAMETQGVNSWLNGESSSIGSVNYEDYTDVAKELNGIAENLQDHARVTKEYGVDGYYFTSYEGEVLTASEVKSIAQQLLSGKAKRQMEINGWGNYDRGSKDLTQLTGTFSDFSEKQLSQIDKDIAKYEAQSIKLKGVDEAKSQAFAKQAKDLKGYRSKTDTRHQEFLQDPNTYRHVMSGTMEQENVLNAFGNTFQINNVSTELKANSVAMHMDKMKIAEAKLQLEYEKQAAKYKSDMRALSGSYTNDSEINMLSEVSSAAKASESAAKGAILNTMSNLPQAIQDDITNSYNPESGISKEEHIYNELMKDKATNLVSIPELAALDNAVEQWHSSARLYKESMDAGIRDAEAGNLNTIVEEYKDNTGVTMLDESGNKVSVADYLGDLTGTDLNKPENKAKKEQILKSYYADKILSKEALTGLKQGAKLVGAAVLDAALNPLAPGAGTLKTSVIGSGFEKQQEELIMKARLVELTGSEEAANKYIEASKKAGNYDTNSGFDIVSDRVKFLRMFNWDNSATDDNTIDGWVNLENIKKGAKSYLNENPQKSINRPILIPGDSAAGKDLVIPFRVFMVPQILYY
jgi:hypothetical protein